jgi:microcystin-dependent protein
MASPFLGQIEIFGFNYAPKNWVQCRGQLLSIQQHQALFALLGTSYGGNGVSTFGLPDLQGRVPVGVGQDQQGVQWTVGQIGGSESIALTLGQIAAHDHQVKASTNTNVSGNNYIPSSSLGLGQTTALDNAPKTISAPAYAVASAVTSNYVPLGGSAISTNGSSQPHENRMPSLVLNACISLAGVFPSRN